jgi:hypothetical protein
MLPPKILSHRPTGPAFGRPGSRRCPRQKWIPAFAGKARRGHRVAGLSQSILAERQMKVSISPAMVVMWSVFSIIAVFSSVAKFKVYS